MVKTKRNEKGWWEKPLGVVALGVVVTVIGSLIFWAITRDYDKPQSSTSAPTSQPAQKQPEAAPAQPAPDNGPSPKPIPPAKIPKRATGGGFVTNPANTEKPPATSPKMEINAPNGIAIGGGVVTNPTVNNNYGPVPRRLSDQTKNELRDCLQKKVGRFSIGALQGNGEAYKYAEQWRELLLSAGWEIEHKDIPIQIFMIGGGTYSGIRFTVHDASMVQGKIELAEGSPEQNFRQCVLGRNDISGGGSMIPYKDFPTGSVSISISYQP